MSVAGLDYTWNEKVYKSDFFFFKFKVNYSQNMWFYKNISCPVYYMYRHLTHFNFYQVSPRNENLKLLVWIKFLSLFYIFIYKIKTEKFSCSNKVLPVLGWKTGAHREDCLLLKYQNLHFFNILISKKIVKDN
jgi:hypothetical protein